MARPVGLPKTGGRSKGTQNRRTLARHEKFVQSGMLPLEYMLSVMRNAKTEAPVRLDAAKAAAPYIHPKLATIAHTGPNGGPVQTIDLSKLTHEQLVALEPVLAQLAASGRDAAGEGEGGDPEA